MDDSRTGGIVLGGCVIWLLAFAFGYLIGSTECRKATRAEAVAAGHAEYYLDDDNNRQWRWKE